MWTQGASKVPRGGEGKDGRGREVGEGRGKLDQQIPEDLTNSKILRGKI